MTFLEFFNYIVFNKDNLRVPVWNAVLDEFNKLQIERWKYLHERLETN